MAGLKEWFKQDWVDIGAKKKGGFVARGCGKIMSNRRKKTKMR